MEDLAQTHNASAFKEITTIFKQALLIRKVAHIYGTLATTISYQGHTLNLEGSYHNTFADLSSYKKQFLATLPANLSKFLPKISSTSLDKLQGYFSYPEPVTIEAITVSTVFPDGAVHFSSFTICKLRDPLLTSFIAVGNVGAGADDYIGIQVYQLPPFIFKQYEKVYQHVKVLLLNSANAPIPHSSYLQLIELLQGGKPIFSIPVLEQLRGYCGFKSAEELNEFSKLFFQVMAALQQMRLANDKYTGNPWLIPLASVAPDYDLIHKIALNLHSRFISYVREQMGQELLQSLRASKVQFNGEQFYQDWLSQAKRYRLGASLINDLTQYMQERGFATHLPKHYQKYLLQERYGRNLDKIRAIFAPQAHEEAYIEEQANRLVGEFLQLSHDFDEARLETLSAQDSTLGLLMTFGYNRACNIVKSKQGPDKMDYYLSGKYSKN